jgi:hypothetical protein
MLMSSLRQLVREVFTFFKEHLVFVVSILVVSASINIKLYYSSLYHFDIIPFVSAQEILAFSFLSLGELNLPIILAILIIVAMVEVSIQPINTSLIPIKYLLGAKRLILNSLLFIPFYEILEFCFLLMYANYTDSRNLIFDLSEADLYINVLSIISIGIFFYLNVHSILISSHKVTYVLVILSVITIGTFSNSLKSGLQSKYFKTYKGTKVIVESDTIISTSRFMYIGQTNGYVFHYEFDDNKTFVTPMSQVKQIEIVSQDDKQLENTPKVKIDNHQKKITLNKNLPTDSVSKSK